MNEPTFILRRSCRNVTYSVAVRRPGEMAPLSPGTGRLGWGRDSAKSASPEKKKSAEWREVVEEE